MTHTVKDEKELPTTPLTVEYRGQIVENPRRHQEYLRSLCDPRVYIETLNGDVFVRADGQNWKYPAFEVIRGDRATTRAPRVGWGDTKQYEYQGGAQ